MRKKLFTFLLALAASIGSLFAASGTCGPNLTWNLTDGVLTISGIGDMKDYATYVTGEAPWYKSRSLIESVIINEGCTSIGDYAFAYCRSLTSVTIPSSITSIGKCAFEYCSGLTSVYITDIAAWCGISFNNYSFVDSNPLSRANNLYLNGNLLTDLVIPNSVTSIGSYAFHGCTSLTSVTIPNSVTSIGSDAFSACRSLTSVTIPNSVTSIGSDAFNNCTGLTSIEIPNSVTSIGGGAFSGCTGLTSVTIPNSVTSIGSHAFNGCTGLTSVTIPNSVTSIEDNAFSGCTGLTSVNIPSSVTKIEWYAFSGCTGLTSVTIPNSVTSIGMEAFSGCTSLTSVIWNAKNCADFTSTSTPFYLNTSYDIRSQITSFVFGDEVEYIPAYLCAGMNNAQIIIKNCRTEIGAHALDNCSYSIEGAYSIVLPDTTLCYSEELIIDGVRYDLQKTPNKKQTWTRNLQTVNGCDSIIEISVFWKKLPDFSITTKDVYDTKNSGSISYKIDQYANYDGEYYYTLNGIRNASLSNLSAGDCRLVFYSEECGDSIVKNITIHQLGMKVNGLYYLLNENNHTATLTYRGTSYSDYSGEYSGNITIPKTITFEGIEYQVTGINSSTFSGCSNISTITMESEIPISMYNSGLSNNCIIYVPYGSVNAYKSASGWRNYTIHVINPSHVTSTAGATSATITLGNTNEAQHIASCGMEGGAEEFAGNVIEYIGLEPNSEYVNIPLFIKTKEGDLDNTTVSFTTTALELTTKASKPVSSTTAILLAETNMSDAEVSCGFEYKRNDAPADMDGTKVFCPVASGQMAGRLKNLKDDVYYKYRAFYQSAAGNMYYGDWQYIFTGDVAVEFDPILYTYGATVVRENEATISGYALAGSEDFTEQGFEYWAESRANNGANAPRRMPAALGEHFFVQASGISLRVTLTNLDAGTVYKYRVYGKVGDQYYYGSEQTFTTQGTYTPPTYTITFANWDGTELQSSQVEEGTLPEYTGATPVRPEDEQNTYSFNGWSPAIVAATADATYTATYTATPKSQGIEEVPSDQVLCTKVHRNGQIFILRGEKTYTIDGRKVR